MSVGLLSCSSCGVLFFDQIFAVVFFREKFSLRFFGSAAHTVAIEQQYRKDEKIMINLRWHETSSFVYERL